MSRLTSRDVLEADSFHRRRLVTAFISGAPGGREVEPRRDGRTIVAAVMLGLLLASGTAAGRAASGHTTTEEPRHGCPENVSNPSETGAVAPQRSSIERTAQADGP
jgi:hypothetical protein